MAGIPSGGQKLTPPFDVNAPAGKAGDVWGANGGGVDPCNTITEATALSTGMTQNNYKIRISLGGRALGSEISSGALDKHQIDSALANNGSTQG